MSTLSILPIAGFVVIIWTAAGVATACVRTAGRACSIIDATLVDVAARSIGFRGVTTKQQQNSDWKEI